VEHHQREGLQGGEGEEAEAAQAEAGGHRPYLLWQDLHQYHHGHRNDAHIGNEDDEGHQGDGQPGGIG